MKAVKVKDDIYWVGGVDYAVRSFHGYNTERGATYNAYLIIDEKVTLIDTVKEPFTDELIARIESVIPIEKIDYVISNHAEFDHSGAVREIARRAPNAKILATAAGVKTLTNLYGALPAQTVKPGETLTTGKYTFRFLPTPMVHWPDNMVTYLPSEKILFSNDAFGQHLATSTRFDTDTDYGDAMREAKKYYANIVLPYAAQVSRALSSVKELDLDIIAPSHGIIWTKHIPDIMKMYEFISAGGKDNTAVVAYDSMWGNTAKLAKLIGAALEEKYDRVIYADLKTTHMADVMTELSTASCLAVGSPTLNNTMMPNVAAFLCYLKGLNPAPKGIRYCAFGSYGWGGGAVKQISEILSGLHYEPLADISVNFRPEDADLSPLTEKL